MPIRMVFACTVFTFSPVISLISCILRLSSVSFCLVSSGVLAGYLTIAPKSASTLPC